MPTVKLTQTYINSLATPDSGYWVLDSVVPGLRLYVGKHKKTYYLKYKNSKGKSDTFKIGDENLFTPIQARETAKKFLAEMATNGTDIKTERKPKIDMVTLGDICEKYKNAGGSQYILDNVRLAFENRYSAGAMEITPLEIETWRQTEIKNGTRKKISINHKTSSLKTLFNWAEAHEIIPENPLKRLKKLTENDSNVKIRYLTNDERTRLFNALDDRESHLRAARQRTLDGGHRQYLAPLDGVFADYFKPLIILALNTGIRQNALFSLRWDDIDLEHTTIHLRAQNAKNKKNDFIPMNKTVSETLIKWREQSDLNNPLVFPSPKTGEKLDNCKKNWTAILKTAGITNFRWHDMRHDFASRLVMAGVDLNTVRELMTHSDIKMTLRYAHLAPEKKQSAVEKINETLI